jgi:predicted RNA-binding protein YlxR (DUF448 family)
MRKNIYKATPAKSQPLRTCTVCRQIKGKKELVRIVRTPEGKIEIDVTGKKEGRGAYLCRQQACWDKLAKGKQLENAFKSGINKNEVEQLIKNGKDLLKE